MKERKVLGSNFILIRALIEIVSRVPSDGLDKDLGDKLEEMVFSQLKNVDLELISKSINRQNNLALFSELMGSISSVRFASVSAKFIASLEHGLKDNKLDPLIRGMRFLKLKLYPMELLDETVIFLQKISDVYKLDSHSQATKQALSEVLVELLGPVAEVMIILIQDSCSRSKYSILDESHRFFISKSYEIN